MKTMRLAFSVIIVVLLASNHSWGQNINTDVIVTINGIDYGEGIGMVYGNYTYHFNFRVSDAGKLECLHWNAKNFNLYNANGDKVQVIDSGHDTFGVLWDFFNNPAFYNAGYAISYSVPDGWLDGIMPTDLPAEGSFVNMSCKIKCKGNMVRWGSLTQIKMNANGEITANIVKSWLE
jgi:hypothetical protein